MLYEKNFSIILLFFLGFASAVALNEVVGINKLKEQILSKSKSLFKDSGRNVASQENEDKLASEGEGEEVKKKKGLPVHSAVVGIRVIIKYFTTY